MTECDHDNMEAIGDSPDNLFVDGSYFANEIKCLDCDKTGIERYEFIGRVWND